MLAYLLVALTAGGVCCVFYLETLDMAYAAAHTPQILCGIIVLLGIWMVADVARHTRRVAIGSEATQKADPADPYLDPFFKNVNLKRLAVFTISLIIYVFLIEDLGYVIVTPIFLMFSFLHLKATSILKSLIITLSVVGVIYTGFVFLLGLPVPMGVLS